MKRIILVIFSAIVFTYCSSTKSSQTSASGGGTENSTEIKSGEKDTLIITGTHYIPIQGRTETGTTPSLEGTWELLSINGSTVSGGIKPEILDSLKKLPPGTEIKRDSSTIIDSSTGVTREVTEVNIDRMGSPIKRITPTQGSNYHIPEKPRISFFGSNETFSGFTGCNKMSGRYKMIGKDSLNLHNASASTKMVCLGEFDENNFINTLHRVTKFKAENGQLHLMQGNDVLLVFTKKQ